MSTDIDMSRKALVHIASKACGDNDTQIDNEFLYQVMEKNTYWIAAIGQLIEHVSWDGDLDADQTSAIALCSELTQSLANMNNYFIYEGYVSASNEPADKNS
jgi:hypothetical protein